MQSHEKWMIKAQNDLRAAKILLEGDCLDVAIYHTQQCAEKALKGYLAFHKRPLVKTHDLVALVALCREFYAKFSLISSAAERLTPFSITFRYPDIEIYPPKKTVVTSLQDAKKILRFVEMQIKKELK